MKFQKAILTAVLCGSWLVGNVAAQQDPKADNTKVNKRDRDSGQATADQQKENTNDRDLAKKIRQSIVADKALSTYAHNVKVIVQHGSVTLKGPVRSADEKKTIVAKATEVIGDSAKVVDQITIKP